MGLKKIKRKIVMDDSGVMPLTWLLIFMTTGGAGTLLTYWYESTEGALISADTSPTLAGIGIDYLWVIVALITVVSVFVWVAFGRSKPRNN